MERGRGRPSSYSSHLPFSEEWEVEYSRFFNFPSRPFPSPALRPLSKRKYRSGGTWVTASSLALLRLRDCATSSGTVLSVSVPGIVYEEHFITNLHVSFPRLSCLSQCSDGGSRAIILSFRDCSDQIQKFALRFSSYSVVQIFLANMKGSPGDIMEVEVSNFACENSISCLTVSPSMIEFGMKNPSSLRDKESNIGGSDCVLSLDDVVPEFSQSNYTAISSTLPPTISSTLPPSFSDLLTDCYGKGQQEQSKSAISDHSSGNEISLLSYLADVSAPEVIDALLQPKPDFTVNSELMKYASNASFHDMLNKIEAIITELGGDMSL